MKRIFIIQGIILIVMIISAIILVNFFTGKYAEQKQRVLDNKELVGESIVLRQDTIMVTNYNTMKNSFDLEDGTVASPEMVKKLMIKKD